MEEKIIKEDLENKTYEFIGRLALILFSQNIRMSFSSLRQVLKDNGYQNYATTRGMARGLSAAYRRWQAKEKDRGISVTADAIAHTFVGKYGNHPWY